MVRKHLWEQMSSADEDWEMLLELFLIEPLLPSYYFVSF